MGRTRSQIFLASPVREKPQFPPLCTPPWPGGCIIQKTGTGSARHQPGQPDWFRMDNLESWVLGSGVQGYYLLLRSCGKGAGSDIHAVSSGHVLATGCAPHLNGQVVLDTGHQLGREGRSRSGVLEDYP